MKIDISGLEKGRVLQALYNAARPGEKSARMTLIEADSIVEHHARERRMRFNTINGRAIYVDLGGDVFESQDYDKANGANVAASAIAPLRLGKKE